MIPVLRLMCLCHNVYGSTVLCEIINSLGGQADYLAMVFTLYTGNDKPYRGERGWGISSLDLE